MPPTPCEGPTVSRIHHRFRLTVGMQVKQNSLVLRVGDAVTEQWVYLYTYLKYSESIFVHSNVEKLSGEVFTPILNQWPRAKQATLAKCPSTNGSKYTSISLFTVHASHFGPGQDPLERVVNRRLAFS